MKEDLQYRLRRALRNRMHSALAGRSKSAGTLKLVGCTIGYLRYHLRKQFGEGMSWSNYGELWHIDHIRPCASFDLSDPAQQRACFHYTNLQPLWGAENLSKNSRWEGVLWSRHVVRSVASRQLTR